jgi:hypothetical protein
LIKKASRILINEHKSTISCYNFEEDEIIYTVSKMPQVRDLDEGSKYLGFQLKPNDYRKADW